jgi:CelD/BcsL family acetyltransferase involved in cellulose biosynthesis
MTRTIPHGLSHRWLSSVEEIEAEREPWEALVEERYDGNPFLSPDYHLLWLNHFVTPPTAIRYLKILTPDRPVAYFPRILTRESFHGVTVPVLRYAGNIYNPMNCPLFPVDETAPVLVYLVRRVLPELRWTVLRADTLPAEHPGATELHQALVEAGHHAYLGEHFGNWIYERPGVTAEAYFRELSAKIPRDARRLAKNAKGLSARGDLRFRVVNREFTPGDVEAYRLVYSRSWKGREIAPNFHPDLMALASRRGWLRLAFLEFADRPIATQFGLYRRQRCYMIRTAYDEEFKRFAPGSLLLWRLIEHLINTEQMQFFDLLIGDEAYKKNWTNCRRPRLDLLAFPQGLRGASWRALDRGIVPWLRRHPFFKTGKRAAGLALRWVTGSREHIGPQ